MPQTYSPDAVDRARRIEFFLMDVDGVLTDGQILMIPDSNGSIHEYKMFDVQDGVGLSFARRASLRLGILTGRWSESVQVRAKELGVEVLEQGHFDKGEAFDKILIEIKLQASQVAYMGDDVQDIPALHRAGLAIGPANATADVRKHLHLLTEHSGGRGAVREAIEFILRAQGKWDQIVARYLESQAETGA
jgi:3-deoxy-D-manno-octulosonate 8-phosphate phosphatase (KDO 8-P phosphatase)